MNETITTTIHLAATSAMALGLERLWVKFLPEIEKRIAELECFSRSLAEARTSPAEEGRAKVYGRSEAHAAAHKLTGILGTFGIARGTELARQIEHLLMEPGELGVEDVGNLSEWVGELRLTIEDRSR